MLSMLRLLMLMMLKGCCCEMLSMGRLTGLKWTRLQKKILVDLDLTSLSKACCECVERAEDDVEACSSGFGMCRCSVDEDGVVGDGV